MSQLFQIPSEISKIQTMSHGALRLQIDTQENVSPESISKLMNIFEKLGYFTFSVETIKPEDLLSLPEIKEFPNEKSLSERLRNVLYVWHEQRGGKKEDFEAFRTQQMNKIIEQIKSKLS
jgi:hypothetical protein